MEAHLLVALEVAKKYGPFLVESERSDGLCDFCMRQVTRLLVCSGEVRSEVKVGVCMLCGAGKALFGESKWNTVLFNASMSLKTEMGKIFVPVDDSEYAHRCAKELSLASFYYASGRGCAGDRLLVRKLLQDHARGADGLCMKTEVARNDFRFLTTFNLKCKEEMGVEVG